MGLRALAAAPAALLLVVTACGGKPSVTERPLDEAFADAKPGRIHVRARTPDDDPKNPTPAGWKRRTYEAVSAVDGVYTLQFARDLPDAGRAEDADAVTVFNGRSVIEGGAEPPRTPPALLVSKGDEASIGRVALAVRAGEVVTIRFQTPGDGPAATGGGSQTIEARLFLGAANASTSNSVTKTTKGGDAKASGSSTYSGTELVHAVDVFHRVRDTRPVTLLLTTRGEGKPGTAGTETFTLRLRFAPEYVESDHSVDGD